MGLYLRIDRSDSPWAMGRELKEAHHFLNKLETKGNELLTQKEKREIGQLKGRVVSLPREHLTPKERMDLKLIEQRLMAYDYRYDLSTPSTDEGAITTLCTQLETVIGRYKKSPEIYPSRDSDLTEKDKNQIRVVSTKYPRFAELLLKNNQKGGCTDHLTKNFIKWAFKDGCSVDVFVQFPHEREQFSACHLGKRTGAIHGTEGIKVCDLHGRKVVTLKINNVDVSVLDKNQKVHLPNRVDQAVQPYVVKIKELYEQFKKKTKSYENVEYTSDGVVNWHSGLLASYDHNIGKYDFVSSDKWLEKAPVLIRMTREELKQHYPGQAVCENGCYGYGVRATRTTHDYNFADCHAYIELIVPDGDDRFKVYPIGLQTVSDFPQTTWEKLTFIAATKKGAIHYPDESFFLSHRQAHGEFFSISKEEFNTLEAFIAHSIDKVKGENKIFQPIGNNCANFAQKCHRVINGKRIIEPLEDLIYAKLGKSPLVISKVNSAIYAFDDESLEDLLSSVLPMLSYQEITDLMGNCHETLVRTLMRNLPGDLPLMDEFNALNVGSKQVPTVELQNAVKELVSLTLKSQYFFPMHILNADYHNCLKYIIYPLRAIDYVLKGIIQFIRCVLIIDFLGWLVTRPLQWLRNSFITILVLILGGAYWYNVTAKTGEIRRKMVLTNKYQWRHTFNLPCAMWKWKKEEATNQKESAELMHRIKDMMKRNIPSIPLGM